MSQQSPGQVVFVVVAYFPRGPIRPFQGQGHRVLIVDNTPTDRASEAVAELSKLPGVEVIRPKANLGIAKALNLGCERAFAAGAEFVVTMDQDTTLDGVALDHLLRVWNAREADPSTRAQTGLIGPVHYDRGSGHVSRELVALSSDASGLVERDYIMTSGNLLHRSVWGRVGRFADELFIEYVDHDYGLRCWRAGLAVGLVPQARMAHSLGEMRSHRWLGLWTFFSHNYAPVRRYYRARNRLLIYWRHAGVRRGGWILQDLGFAARDLAKIILVEDGKLRKIWAFVEGTVDALVGIRGAYPGPLWARRARQGDSADPADQKAKKGRNR